MSLARLVLLRHGRTTWNAEHRMQGRLDPDLDDVGLVQVQAAAAVVAGEEPTTIVASDQLRAWRTAEIAGKAIGLVPRGDARLRETSVGDWEGLTGDEIEVTWPGDLARWRVDPTWAPPAGESRLEVAARARPVVDDLVAEYAHEADPVTVLLVAHGGTFIALTGSTLGWPRETWPTLAPLGNCHWAVLDRRHDRWRIAEWNRRV